MPRPANITRMRRIADAYRDGITIERMAEIEGIGKRRMFRLVAEMRDKGLIRGYRRRGRPPNEVSATI